MKIQTDKEFLKDKQYKDAKNYGGRTGLWNYSEPKFNIWEWTAKHYDFSTAKNVLEVGCGTGVFWQSVASRLSDQHHIVLTDFAEVMLAGTRENLKDVKFPCPVDFKIADVENLPFADKSFDAILAHLMIYHVPSPEKALSEIKRVLKPGGWVGISTATLGSWYEIFTFAHALDPRIPLYSSMSGCFPMERADMVLPDFFPQIKKYIHQIKMKIPTVEPIMNFLRTHLIAQTLNLSEEFFQKFEQVISAELKKKGVFMVNFYSTLYVCS